MEFPTKEMQEVLPVNRKVSTERAGARANLDPTAFVAACEKLARERFGLSSLRPAQRLVLERLACSSGVLATLPTGAGKTLLYALPALLWAGGPVLVISPLISLMRDQARRMEQANISTAVFTSDQSPEERREVWRRVMSGQVRLLFASPERLSIPSFLSFVCSVAPEMVVIDEAHCVVQWGTSFRPEYADIGRYLEVVNPGRVLALTATASRSGRKIIRESLFPSDRVVDEIVFPPLASNIFVRAERVYSEDEKWQTLLALFQSSDFGKAIVYFPRREACDQAARNLRKEGLHAVSYHAGLTKEERRSVESYVHLTKRGLVICATQAFGMGVDLAGVRLVVVYGFPGGIEEFFQMVGRAGRGGEPAQGVLLWSGSDPKKRRFQFDISFPPVDEVRLLLADMTRLFLGSGESRIVSADEMRERISVAEKKREQKLEGILAALRIMGVVENLQSHEKYLSLSFSQHLSADLLFATLPEGVTRRSRVLEALCLLSIPSWRARVAGRTVVSIRALCEECSFPWERCVEVLEHFSREEKIGYEVIENLPSGGKWLLHGSLSDALGRLSRYTRLRSEYEQSLSQLEHLAEKRECRLKGAQRYFGAGVTNQAAPQSNCGQCDICLSSYNSASSTKSFQMFAARLGK